VTASAAQPDYAAAARRHHEDARHLFGVYRLATADHLAGFATECLLKQVQVSYLRFTARPGGPPRAPGNGRALTGHLPSLWAEMSNLVRGRSGSKLAPLLSSTAPFQHWQVDDRYSDGLRVTQAVVAGHLSATKTLADAIEQDVISGALT